MVNLILLRKSKFVKLEALAARALQISCTPASPKAHVWSLIVTFHLSVPFDFAQLRDRPGSPRRPLSFHLKHLKRLPRVALAVAALIRFITESCFSLCALSRSRSSVKVVPTALIPPTHLTSWPVVLVWLDRKQFNVVKATWFNS